MYINILGILFKTCPNNIELHGATPLQSKARRETHASEMQRLQIPEVGASPD